MSESPRRYLVAYDIPDDRRRSRLAHLLETYGYRAQYSVFVLDLRPARLVQLEAKIAGTIRMAEDSVLLCDLGDTEKSKLGRFRYIGCSNPTGPDGPVVI